MILLKSFSAVNRGYGLFEAGEFVFTTGMWILFTALGWVVFELTSSYAALALTAAAFCIPVFILFFLGGIAADFIDRKKLVIFTRITASVPSFFLYFLSKSGGINLEWIVALAALSGIISSFEYSAHRLLIAELAASRGRALKFFSLSVIFNASVFLGSLAAGLIIVTVGAELCFLINAFTSITGALIFLFVKSNSPENAAADRLTRVSSGYKFILQKKEILAVYSILTAVCFLGISFVSILPFYAKSIVKTDALGFGILCGAICAGMLAANFTSTEMAENKNPWRSLVISAFFFAITLFIFAQTKTLSDALLVLAAAGWGLFFILFFSNRILRSLCSENMGFVIKETVYFSSMFFIPAGFVFTGFLIYKLGFVYAISLNSIFFALTVFSADFFFTNQPVGRGCKHSECI